MLNYPLPKIFQLICGVLITGAINLAGIEKASGVTTVVYASDAMATDAGLTTSQITGWQASGFKIMVLFSMSIDTNGNFWYSGQEICSGGSYIGPSNWGTLLNQCLGGQGGMYRIEMCIGGWGDQSFLNIKNLIAAQGNNTNNILYQNLAALHAALPITAINYDDEYEYDTGSAVTFGIMAGSLGMQITLCPYTNPSYWQSVASGLSNCDYCYLQTYSGGAGNDPTTWASWLGGSTTGTKGVTVMPLYWDNDRNATFLTNMLAWGKEGCVGGGLYESCYSCNPEGGLEELSLYAYWIRSGLEPAFLQTTNALDVAANSTYTGDGAPNGLSPGGQNGGFGFGAWTFTVGGTGGAFIQTSGPSGDSFDLWNTSGNNKTVAIRPFGSPLSPGQSFSVQIRLNSLDSSSQTNALVLQDASGNTLFRYWHVGYEPLNGRDGSYADASTNNGAAVNFRYDYQEFDSFMFTLNSATTYTFTDNTTGASLSGSLSGAPIAGVAFVRNNGNPPTSGGQDFQFDTLMITSPGVLSLQRMGGSNQLSWTSTGTLQSAPAVTGPWTDSANQANPQTLSTTNLAQFFRLRQ
jgi:hypothetical protein